MVEVSKCGHYDLQAISKITMRSAARIVLFRVIYFLNGLDMKIRQEHLHAIIKSGALAVLWSTLGATFPVFAEGTTKAKLATPPETLCTHDEVVLFSCKIKSKIASLCAPVSPESKTVRSMNYRFGSVGASPELDYPKRELSPTNAFSFSSTSRSFLLEAISFSRGNVSYEVITPDSRDYVQWVPFTGVGVTLLNKPTVLMACNQGSVFVDLSPLKALLEVKPNAGFSASAPKVAIDDSPFPVIKKSIRHGKKWTTKLAYPEIAEPSIRKEVSQFVADCYETEGFEGGDEGQCVRSVSAKIINGRVLALRFDDYEYHSGTPHGYGNTHTALYRKKKKGWQLIGKDDVFDASDSCQSRIGSMIYRKLKPLLLDRLEDGTVGPDDILDEADVSLNAQGVVFTFQPYDLGAYAEGPGSIMIPYKAFGECFHW